MIRRLLEVRSCVLLFLSLLAVSADAREILRYSPPAKGGAVSVTLTTDENSVKLVHNAALKGGPVSVSLSLDATEHFLFAQIYFLDELGQAVGTSMVTVPWPSDRIDVGLEWSDFRGNHDWASAELRSTTAMDLRGTTGLDFKISSTKSGRELELRVDAAGLINLAADGGNGESEILGPSSVNDGDDVTCVYDEKSGLLTISSPGFATSQTTLEPGSVLSVSFSSDAGPVRQSRYELQ